MIPFNAIPDANVIPANDGLAIADPGSLRVTLRKVYCLIFNFRDFPGDPDKTRVGSGADVRRLKNRGVRNSAARCTRRQNRILILASILKILASISKILA